MAGDVTEVTHQDKVFEVDEDGFITAFENWCPEWVDFVRESEGIPEVTDRHILILTFIQDYYRRNGLAPMVRTITKGTGLKLKEIYELFPSGPARGACRMAGLPSPTGCV